MDRHIYINLRYANLTDDIALAVCEQSRDPYYLPESDISKYDISIDRFSLHHCILPIYEYTTDLKIKCIRTLDSVESIVTVDFKPYLDVHNLIWNITDFFTAINNALQTIISDLTIPSNISLLFDRNTYKANFNHYDGFTTAYIIQFNEPLYAVFHSFDYINVQFNQSWFTLNTLNVAPYQMQTIDTIELSPVDKILVKAVAPISPEMTPPTQYATQNSDQILTDFEINGVNKTYINNIMYTATTGQYRMHSLKKSNWNYIKLSFYYSTYIGNTFQLYIVQGGSVDVKLYIKLN